MKHSGQSACLVLRTLGSLPVPYKWVMVVYTYNANIQEVEAGGSTIQQIQGYPRIQETLSKNENKSGITVHCHTPLCAADVCLSDKNFFLNQS